MYLSYVGVKNYNELPDNLNYPNPKRFGYSRLIRR